MSVSDKLRARLYPALDVDPLTVMERHALVAVVEAAAKTRTNIGLTVYEGTPVSVVSGKMMEKELGDALVALDEVLS